MHASFRGILLFPRLHVRAAGDSCILEQLARALCGWCLLTPRLCSVSKPAWPPLGEDGDNSLLMPFDSCLRFSC